MKQWLTLCLALSGSALACSESDGTPERNQFERGFPVEGTAQQVYDASDLRRAIEAYKVFVPTVASEAVIQQIAGQGGRPNEMGMVHPNQPMQQFQATNSDTPYALTTLDLRAGPMVVEMPANPLLLGNLDDHNMTWVTNVGGIGPEEGRGGKHLFLPPGYDGSVPEGFFVSRSQTWELVVLIRTVPLDTNPDDLREEVGPKPHIAPPDHRP